MVWSHLAPGPARAIPGVPPQMPSDSTKLADWYLDVGLPAYVIACAVGFIAFAALVLL